ncbi:TPA: hypothetical protein NGR40_004628 [Vibrio parahaemolyticus]|nr:hypothetical protein [Vibrio parahaemolyticus]HCG6332331.1 hypothetical protein [Vibrio parahaemolyticus]
MTKKSARKKKNQSEKKLRLEYEKRQARRIQNAEKLRKEQEELAEELATQKVAIPPYRRGT